MITHADWLSVTQSSDADECIEELKKFMVMLDS